MGLVVDVCGGGRVTDVSQSGRADCVNAAAPEDDCGQGRFGGRIIMGMAHML